MGELYPARLVGHAHDLREAGASPRISPTCRPGSSRRVGGSTTHWAGASLRFDEHEFKAKTTAWQHPRRQSAGLADHAAEMEPWYAKAEDKMGVTRTNGIAGLPGNNNFKVMEAGAKKLGYKRCTLATWRSTARHVTGAAPASRSASASRAASRCEMVDALYRDPQGRGDRKSFEVRPNSMVIKIEHDASGKVTGGSMPTRAARCSARRRAWWRSRQLDREPAAVAQQRLDHALDGLANSSSRSAATICGT